jgi:hypothetical protein
MATANEHCFFAQEGVFGTPPTSPVLNTSLWLIPLIDSNSAAFMEDPKHVTTPFGGGEDTDAEVVSDQQEVKFSVSTLGYVSLAPFLLKWSATRINAGQTLPWVTTEPARDVASCTAYKTVRGRDGANINYAYPGCKVMTVNGTVSRQDPRLKLKLDGQAQKEFPNAKDSSAALTPPTAPTDANYPRGCYLFSQTSGGITFGGGLLARYSDLSFTLTNKLDPQWYESSWLQTLGCHGGEATADMTLQLTSTANMKSTYQAVTQQAFSVVFTAGANTLTIDFQGKVYLSKLNYDLPLGKEFAQKASFKGLYSVSTGLLVGVSST